MVRMISSVVFLVILSLLCFGSLSHTPEEWKTRLVYQIITDRFAKSQDTTQGCGDLSNYCGGTFLGIINHLDYIKNLGFNAIWISPVVDNVDKGYHGYWARDFYNVNSHFGSSNDLKKLVDACHAKDIWVMVDVVANHVGPVGYNYGSINPFNSASYYHDCNNCPSGCSISNYQDQTQVEHCRLAGLPDLDQSNSFVSKTLYSWIGNLTRFYGFDGVRIDTVPEVLPSFWPGFNQNAGVYCVGEVFDGRVDYVASFSKLLDGVLSYPLFFTMRSVFQGKQSMKGISTMLQTYSNDFKNLDYLGTFIDNHDNARFLSGQQDQVLYQNAIAYVLLGQGLPILYYGTEQAFHGPNDPNNREPLWTSGFSTNNPLYSVIGKLAKHRTTAQLWKYPQVQRYSDDQIYAFTRGTTFVALQNGGQNGNQITRSITYHPYATGTKLCNLIWPTDCITVQNGAFSLVLNQGEFKVFSPA